MKPTIKPHKNYLVQFIKHQGVENRNRKSIVSNMIKFFEISKKYTHTAATTYALEAKIVPHVMCELRIIFSIVCNFLLKCIKYYGVIRAHKIRKEQVLVDLTFAAKINFQNTSNHATP